MSKEKQIKYKSFGKDYEKVGYITKGNTVYINLDYIMNNKTEKEKVACF